MTQYYEKESDREFEIIFANNLLKEWIIKSNLNNISIEQKLWTYSRLENFSLKFNEVTIKLNLIKLFQLGEIETLYYCLLKLEPDPMTENFHFIKQEDIDWLTSKIESWIGHERANSIKNSIQKIE
jgi:hypothetical protein